LISGVDGCLVVVAREAVVNESSLIDVDVADRWAGKVAANLFGAIAPKCWHKLPRESILCPRAALCGANNVTVVFKELDGDVALICVPSSEAGIDERVEAEDCHDSHDDEEVLERCEVDAKADALGAQALGGSENIKLRAAGAAQHKCNDYEESAIMKIAHEFGGAGLDSAVFVALTAG